MFKTVSAVLLIVAAVFAPQPATAITTPNYSDQWVSADELGWGLSIHQQADVLFVNLFLYGVDGNPTFFSAAAYLKQGSPPLHDIFAGDLYVTHGPWYGAGAFDPTSVVARKVGTLTFDASNVSTTLTYSVDGIVVSRSIFRQTWALEDFTGSYLGGAAEDRSCFDGVGSGHFEYSGPVEIAKIPEDELPNYLSIRLPGNDTCTFRQPQTQSGLMGGGAGGTYYCSNGAFGGGVVFQMERTIAGISGRYEVAFTASHQGQPIPCTAYGRFGAVKR